MAQDPAARAGSSSGFAYAGSPWSAGSDRPMNPGTMYGAAYIVLRPILVALADWPPESRARIGKQNAKVPVAHAGPRLRMLAK